jgi:hypothetical protein
MARDTNLVKLHLAFDALVKAGDESLHAAYDLGQVIDVLVRLYTYKTMADEVDRKPVTIAKYRRLYLRYPTFDSLLMTAHKYDTYDVSILLGSAETLGVKFGYRCGNCGSWDTHRKPKSEQAMAEARGA